jgi:hypothetical protein
MPAEPGRFHSWLSPLVHLSNNWLSMIGVAVVTSAAVFWLFLLPATFRGEMQNPYIGILSYLIVPALFFGGLILIPLGIGWKRRRQRRAGSYPDTFGPLTWANREVRRLVIFIGVLTMANLVIASQLSYQTVTYMESVKFCGTTCHTVMQPEYTAYQNAPHSRVECVACHVGPGASSFVKSKLNGLHQLFGVILQNYPRPIPTPVHNLRPARDTCEGCHWPQKVATDRLKITPTYAADENNTAGKTVLILKVGAIHSAHFGKGVRIRFAPSDEQRQTIPWIEYNGPAGRTVYTAPGSLADPGKLPIREMDCLDCHNRPAHSYELPERAMDNAMSAGLIAPTLPQAKKKGLQLLKASYPTREAAAAQIPQAIEEFYRSNYAAIYAARQKDIAEAGRQVLAIWERNIFPEMKVTWGRYLLNIGHTDSPGCFRCHDDSHSSADGKKVTQDCNACHTVLAVEEAAPKVLEDLGIVASGK